MVAPPGWAQEWEGLNLEVNNQWCRLSRVWGKVGHALAQWRRVVERNKDSIPAHKPVQNPWRTKELDAVKLKNKGLAGITIRKAGN